MRQSSLPSAAFDHGKHFQAVQPPLGQLTLAIEAAEERSFAVVGNLGGCQVGIQISLGIVMRRNLVPCV